MNRYALNVAPINGYATYNGTSSAAVVVSSVGDGLIAKTGESAQSVVLSQSAEAYRLTFPSAVELGASLTQGADETIAHLGSSEHAISLDCQADGTPHRFASSTASISVECVAVETIVPSVNSQVMIKVSSESSAQIAVLGAAYGGIALSGTASARLHKSRYASAEVPIYFGIGAEASQVASASSDGFVDVSMRANPEPKGIHYGEAQFDIAVLMGRPACDVWHLAYVEAVPMNISVGMRHGIGKPAIPTDYTPAHHSNVLFVPRESGTLRVQR